MDDNLLKVLNKQLARRKHYSTGSADDIYKEHNKKQASYLRLSILSAISFQKYQDLIEFQLEMGTVSKSK